MWPCRLKTSQSLISLKTHQLFFNMGGLLDQSSPIYISPACPLISSFENWNSSKASSLATGPNAAEIYRFSPPPIRLRFAINFYSVTKNRLMARTSLPPTHRVQREDEPRGGGGGGKVRKRKRERSRVSFSAACAVVCQRSGRRDAEYIILKAEERSDVSSPLAAADSRTASDFIRAPRPTTVRTGFTHPRGRGAGVAAHSCSNSCIWKYNSILLKYWKDNHIYQVPPQWIYSFTALPWPERLNFTTFDLWQSDVSFLSLQTKMCVSRSCWVLLVISVFLCPVAKSSECSSRFDECKR